MCKNNQTAYVCRTLMRKGGTKNVNLRNFARSYFCFLIVIVIFAIIIAIIGGVAAAGAV